MCGNTNTVSVWPTKRGDLLERADAITDPLFYIPLSDLEKGPATISKDKHYDVGFWIGTLSLGEKKVEIAGFDSGPLKGLVKIPVSGIGRHPPRPVQPIGLSLTHRQTPGSQKMRNSSAPTPKTPTSASSASPPPERSASKSTAPW